MRSMYPAEIAKLFLVAFILTLAGCGGGNSQNARIALEKAFPHLEYLGPVVAISQAPGDDSKWYAVIQNGKVLSFDNNSTVTATIAFIDITSQVAYSGEMGLLGMAFHPDYVNNGEVFLYYIADNPRRSVIARFTKVQNQWQQDIILEVSQPYSNHNGGNIVFGPDNYLYIGLGDGGSGGDPSGYAQNTKSLLGSMLRIDVDSASPYAIPADNPFHSNALCNNPALLINNANCPEIYAWGLRNPWRWSFDRMTGALWLGDVGQGLVEEVDIIQNGANYGWNTMEGDQCYNATSCDKTGLTMPVAVYGHSDNRSIVGGYMYRGQDPNLQQALKDTYLYADTYSTRIWGLQFDGTNYVSGELINSSLQYIYSFAEDNHGELYVLDPAFGASTAGSNIYKIVAVP